MLTRCLTGEEVDFWGGGALDFITSNYPLLELKLLMENFETFLDFRFDHVKLAHPPSPIRNFSWCTLTLRRHCYVAKGYRLVSFLGASIWHVTYSSFLQRQCPLRKFWTQPSSHMKAITHHCVTPTNLDSAWIYSTKLNTHSCVIVCLYFKFTLCDHNQFDFCLRFLSQEGYQNWQYW